MTVTLAVSARWQKYRPFVVYVFILRNKRISKAKVCTEIVFVLKKNIGWPTSWYYTGWMWCGIISWKIFKKNKGIKIFYNQIRIYCLNFSLTSFMRLPHIPGGLISQLQVLDIVINKPFKDNYRKEYKYCILLVIYLDNVRKGKNLYVSSITWQKNEPESLIKSFQKFSISNNICI